MACCVFGKTCLRTRGGKTRFVDRGYVSVVGLVQLVKAAKLSGTQGWVPACVREALGFKAKYKGECDRLDHLCKRGHLIPLERRWHLRQRGGSKDVAVSVWERVPTHEKVYSFCLGMGRGCMRESWGDMLHLYRVGCVVSSTAVTFTFQDYCSV